MVVADQIVDSSITNNNSNNDREVDGDFKRVNEVLESSKACVFSNPTFFLDKKIFPLPQTCTKTKRLKKIASGLKKVNYPLDRLPAQSDCCRSFFFDFFIFQFLPPQSTGRWNLAPNGGTWLRPRMRLEDALYCS